MGARNAIRNRQGSEQGSSLHQERRHLRSLFGLLSQLPFPPRTSAVPSSSQGHQCHTQCAQGVPCRSEPRPSSGGHPQTPSQAT